jgi:hypothetical protein
VLGLGFLDSDVNRRWDRWLQEVVDETLHIAG